MYVNNNYFWITYMIYIIMFLFSEKNLHDIVLLFSVSELSLHEFHSPVLYAYWSCINSSLFLVWFEIPLSDVNWPWLHYVDYADLKFTEITYFCLLCARIKGMPNLKPDLKYVFKKWIQLSVVAHMFNSSTGRQRQVDLLSLRLA